MEEKQETGNTEAGNQAGCAQWLGHMEAGTQGNKEGVKQGREAGRREARKHGKDNPWDLSFNQ